MKDLKFDNQRGTSVAYDRADVVRCRDCEYWMKKPDGVRGACRILSKLINGREAITDYDGFCFSGKKKVVKMDWINVKDKLPEPHTDVLIWGRYGTFIGWYSHTRQMWRSDDYGEIRDVTHWMPLPDAPEVVSE